MFLFRSCPSRRRPPPLGINPIPTHPAHQRKAAPAAFSLSSANSSTTGTRHRAHARPFHAPAPVRHRRHRAILARITQGLNRARALEERLVHNAVRLDAPPRPRTAPPPSKPGSSRTQPAWTQNRRPPALRHGRGSALPSRPPGAPIRQTTFWLTCPRPSRSPPRSAAARSVPSSPTSAAISAFCRAIRYGGKSARPSSNTAAASSPC